MNHSGHPVYNQVGDFTMAGEPACQRGDDVELRASTGSGDPNQNYLASSRTSSLGPLKDHTRRKLKSRHIQLIGIGGTIGTALYVSTCRIASFRGMHPGHIGS
jgi:amino acid permease